MNKNYFAIIMAGGVGSRFWPLSTQKKPKQFHDVLGTGSSFLQQTFNRIAKVVPEENIYILTTSAYANLCLEQLPQLSDNQIIAEPVGRNTAPCNLYAAKKIHKLNPDAKLLVAPSDHLILDEAAFAKAVQFGFDNAEDDALITLGIQPTRPDTGYGYIQFHKDNQPIKEVKTFTEKPNKELAQNFLDSGDFLWNAGIFIWSAKAILNEFNQHLPDMFSTFNELEDKLNTEQEGDILQVVYPQVQNISVDNGILEKAEKVLVIPVSMGWTDLGTWGSLYDNADKDDKGNVTQGQWVRLNNADGNLIRTENKEKLVYIQGLSNYIVVDTEKALLVCPVSEDQSVKQIVNQLKLDKTEIFI